MGALKSINIVNLAIIMLERDTEVEYEDWTIEILFLIKAFYVITTGYNND
jgi:hypothetical protein